MASAKSKIEKKKPAKPEKRAANKPSLPPPVSPVIRLIRKVIREAAPQVEEVLSKTSSGFHSNGIFARITSQEREVMLEFIKGARLTAPPGVLSGTGSRRHLTVASVKEVQKSVLTGLVRQAILLNLKPSKKPKKQK